MYWKSKLALAVMTLMASTGLMAADLAGFWQPEGEPVWVEIVQQGDTATGTVRRNDNKPDAVGRVLFKDVVVDAVNPGAWRGQIYAQRFKENKDATISLPEPDHMQVQVKVGFMSKTIDWQRAESLPEQ